MKIKETVKPYPKIAYSPRYNIRLLGLEKLHPFDSCKYGRSWQKLKDKFGKECIKKWLVNPEHPVTNHDEG